MVDLVARLFMLREAILKLQLNSTTSAWEVMRYWVTRKDSKRSCRSKLAQQEDGQLSRMPLTPTMNVVGLMLKGDGLGMVSWRGHVMYPLRVVSDKHGG